MIALSTIEADLIGHIIFQETPDSTYQIHERRMTRTATLDGLSTISDMGYTASDNTFVVRIKNPPKMIVDRIIYFVRNYPIIKLSNKDGAFLGAINQFKTHLDPVEFTFFVKQKVS